MPAIDELVPFLTPPPSAGIRYGQGKVISFNPETFENQVQWQGITLTNLPVHAGVDALTIQSGDVVSLNGWSPSGGTASWWIAAKVIIPGTSAAEQAISFLRSSLAQQISSDIFAERVHGATIPDSELIDTNTYDDLGVVGPTVPGVQVEAGTMIVFVSGSLLVAANAGDSFSAAAYMGYDIDGPTPVAPSDERAARVTLITTSEPGQITARTGGAFVHTGLTPGTYTVQAKYRVEIGDENQASANDRTLVVIGV